jgi:predicted S18 family serine protease
MFAARAFGIPFSDVTVFSLVESDGRDVPGASAGIGAAAGIAEVVRDAG